MKRFILSVILFGCAFVQLPTATFHWKPVQDATWYLLEVYNGTNTNASQVFRKWYTSAQVNCPDCSITIDLAQGSYYAQVMDWGAYGYGTWVQVEYYFGEASPPPVVWNVPADGTFAEAMQSMTDCGTVYINSDMAEPAISYGENRSASYIIPNYGCDWTIIGDESRPVVTYDPAVPPVYYDGPGVVFLVRNGGTTTIDNLHFIGTYALGDNIDPATGGPVDKDITVLLDAPGNLIFRNNEVEQSGHAGLKHNYGTGSFLIENNEFHDNGFTIRDHHTYLPGGGEYVIRYNNGWNGSGWCVGFGVVYYTIDPQVYGNTCLNNGGGLSIAWAEGAQVYDNLAMNNDRGMWLQAINSEFWNNVIIDNIFWDVDSHRGCGGEENNPQWCTEYGANQFFDRGNIIGTISHPEYIQ